MDKITAYRMSKTMDMDNIKAIKGETVKVSEIKVNEYTDMDGECHKVLAILLENGKMYRTETRAFIDDMVNFISTFDDPADRPAVTIVGATSKRGNEFVKFVIA